MKMKSFRSFLSLWTFHLDSFTQSSSLLLTEQMMILLSVSGMAMESLVDILILLTPNVTPPQSQKFFQNLTMFFNFKNADSRKKAQLRS